jgi:hypothetical protein
VKLRHDEVGKLIGQRVDFCIGTARPTSAIVRGCSEGENEIFGFELTLEPIGSPPRPVHSRSIRSAWLVLTAGDQRPRLPAGLVRPIPAGVAPHRRAHDPGAIRAGPLVPRLRPLQRPGLPPRGGVTLPAPWATPRSGC